MSNDIFFSPLTGLSSVTADNINTDDLEVSILTVQTINGSTGNFGGITGSSGSFQTVTGVTGIFTYLSAGLFTDGTGSFSYLEASQLASLSGGVTGPTGSFTYLTAPTGTISGLTGSTASFQYYLGGSYTGTTGSFSNGLYAHGTFMNGVLQFGSAGTLDTTFNIYGVAGVNYNTGSMPTTNFTNNALNIGGNNQTLRLGYNGTADNGFISCFNANTSLNTPLYINPANIPTYFGGLVNSNGYSGTTGYFGNLLMTAGGITGATASFSYIQGSTGIFGGIINTSGYTGNAISGTNIIASTTVTGVTGFFTSGVQTNQINGVGASNYIYMGAANVTSLNAPTINLNGTVTVNALTDSTSMFSVLDAASTNSYLIVDTVNSQVTLSTTAFGNYCALLVSGGNSHGGIWGNFNTTGYGDSINVGYNFYPTNGLFGTTTCVIPDAGGGTSNISCNFGNILLQTGNVNTAPTTKLSINPTGAVSTPNSTFDDGSGNMTVGGNLETLGHYFANTGLNNASARPPLSTTIQPYEVRALHGVYDDGFLRICAGGGSATSVISAIELSGYSTVSDMSENIVFKTAGTEQMRITPTSISMDIGMTGPTGSFTYIAGSTGKFTSGITGSNLSMNGTINLGATGGSAINIATGSSIGSVNIGTGATSVFTIGSTGTDTIISGKSFYISGGSAICNLGTNGISSTNTLFGPTNINTTGSSTTTLGNSSSTTRCNGGFTGATGSFTFLSGGGFTGTTGSFNYLLGTTGTYEYFSATYLNVIDSMNFGQGSASESGGVVSVNTSAGLVTLTNQTITAGAVIQVQISSGFIVAGSTVIVSGKSGSTSTALLNYSVYSITGGSFNVGVYNGSSGNVTVTPAFYYIIC